MHLVHVSYDYCVAEVDTNIRVPGIFIQEHLSSNRYAKVPEDEPFEIHPATDSEESDSESESETDDSEDERERKLVQLQEQLRQVQEQMKVSLPFCLFMK